MPRFAASDMALHCLPISFLWDARLKWVNDYMQNKIENLTLHLAFLFLPQGSFHLEHLFHYMYTAVILAWCGGRKTSPRASL